MKPRVGLLLGDPSGIGPEIAAKLLAGADVSASARVLVIGDAHLLQAGAETAGVDLSVTETGSAERFQTGDESLLLLPHPSEGPCAYPRAEANAASGGYVLETLRQALRLAREGVIDAICFAPLNKLAMSLGGSPFEDELHFCAHELGWEGHVSELNTFDNLWTTRVTSHIALSEVSRQITGDKVEQAINLAHETLRRAGYERPRIAVAAINPHGGEGGLFGREELDVIAPAVERSRAGGVEVSGPFPSDTVFLRARAGECDAVVTMYHDQGQIAMKLMGFERGITILAGLPVPITTPAHGSAFDIAGQDIARADALRQAYLTACTMA